MLRIPLFLYVSDRCDRSTLGRTCRLDSARGGTSDYALVKCAALRALSGSEISILTASLMSSGTDGREYCRVLGYIQPDIKLEVALPTSWHCRFLMIGNGGYAGENREHMSRTRSRDAAIRSGFLFAQTNTGHDSEVIGGAYTQGSADHLTSPQALLANSK